MADELQTTCLYQEHLALGARMAPFAGWEMPIQYTGIIEEHHAVRRRAGVFDVSHMGRLSFAGRDCANLLQQVLTCDVAQLAEGRARYALICTESGGILDDVILYKRAPDSFLLICNAANTPAVLAWFDRWKPADQDVTLENRTLATGMLALQGPAAAKHLNGVLGTDYSERMEYFQWTEELWEGQPLFITRTGYTGEDGFELIIAAEQALSLWQALLGQGVAPCALGARDTLRLEACLPLHGNDISPETNPVQAGLLWTVALEKGAFIGREAILQAKKQGVTQRLVAFELTQRGIPRAHCMLLSGGQEVGQVTSGGYSPTLQKGIGMGYVLTAVSKVGTPLQVAIRGTRLPALVRSRPFYKRPR